MKYQVEKEVTLLQALELMFPQSSKETLRSYLRDARVFVDDHVVKLSNTKILPSQVVELKRKQPILTSSFNIKQVVKVIYSDTHLIVVDKPAGLLSVSTNFESKKTVHGYLKEKYHPNKVYVIHRLDQETSGVILFALSDVAYTALKELFANHDLERSYIGIVEGYLDQKEGVWESYLFEDKNYRVHITKDPTKGEKAITYYKVLSAKKGYSLLELTLETGKKNQIRVHSQAAGHPIVGDRKYGSKLDPIRRLGLHAHRLSLKHPVTQKMMHFESPLPLEFKKFDG